MVEPVRLAVWSSPRSISTALMRSWENRLDTIVVDEPLYAHYLAETGIDHPGRDDVVTAGETDWRVVVEQLLAPLPEDVHVFYQKHMAHHLLPDIGRGWVSRLTNVLLIRDPREVVASYVRSREHVTADDIGVSRQAILYDDLSAAGAAPLVIDAADFLGDPEPYLRRLCDLAGVAFDARMLSWPRGPRVTDGIWAPYWYASVQVSTGFLPYRQRDVTLGPRGAKVADECRPLYEQLHARRWTP
ncbi:MAG: HAD family hydrolase [Nocardioidaceae bacterium]